MWLLNTKSQTLRSFMGTTPDYVILSHTWQDEEVSFQDVILGEASTKKGWRKVELCCRQAAIDGYEWVWADTCCIDKTSSSELSEAINSMYKWYRNAEICYAYLQDVPSLQISHQSGKYDLTHSRWFTRGWTLQELIAPSNVFFFTEAWDLIGTRNLLGAEISKITGIDRGLLLAEKPLDSYSVVQRLSWAANRQTARPEDQAYALLGILRVSMPLLYGEGSKAFERLQENFLHQNADLSILAHGGKIHKVLASSPRDFATGHDIVLSEFFHRRQPSRNTVRAGLDLSMTTRILCIRPRDAGPVERLVALLDCRREAKISRLIGLRLTPRDMSPKEATESEDSIYCSVGWLEGPSDKWPYEWPEVDENGRLVSVDVMDAMDRAAYRNVVVLDGKTAWMRREEQACSWTHVCVRLADDHADANRFPQLTLHAAWPKQCWTESWTLNLLEAAESVSGIQSPHHDNGSLHTQSKGAIMLKYRHQNPVEIEKFIVLRFVRTSHKPLEYVYFDYGIQLYDEATEEGDMQAGSKIVWKRALTRSVLSHVDLPSGELLRIELKRVRMTDIEIGYFVVSVVSQTVPHDLEIESQTATKSTSSLESPDSYQLEFTKD